MGLATPPRLYSAGTNSSATQVTHIEELPARQAQHGAPAASLAPAVAAALQLRRVARMFTHQAAAVDSLLEVGGCGGGLCGRGGACCLHGMCMRWVVGGVLARQQSVTSERVPQPLA